MLKALRLAPAVFFMIHLSTSSAAAQERFDAYFGMGTASNGSTHQFLDFFQSGVFLETPPLDGLFGAFGGAVMLTPTLGVGAQVSLRFRKGDYAGLGFRPILYDFNGIWTPDFNDVIVPEFQAGFGGMHTRFYDPTAPYLDYYTGQISTFAGSSNHFQLHAAAGLRIYITDRIFLRPQVDYHWVRNLWEFKSNSVPVYTFAIGFSSQR